MSVAFIHLLQWLSKWLYICLYQHEQHHQGSLDRQKQRWIVRTIHWIQTVHHNDKPKPCSQPLSPLPLIGGIVGIIHWFDLIDLLVEIVEQSVVYGAPLLHADNEMLSSRDCYLPSALRLIILKNDCTK